MVKVYLDDLIMYFFLNMNELNGCRVASEEQIKQFVKFVKDKLTSGSKTLVSLGYDCRLIGELFYIIPIDENGSKLWALKNGVTKEILKSTIKDKRIMELKLFEDLKLNDEDNLLKC